MTVVFDTAEVAPEDRLDYWRDSSRQLFLPLHVDSELQAEPFRARSSMYDLCGVKVSRTISVASVVRRTAQDIVERDPECFTLVLGLRGKTVGSQSGRTDSWGPGDLTIWDSSQPWVTKWLEPNTALTFAMPKSMLRRDAQLLAAHTARPVSGTTSRTRLVRRYLYQLVKALEVGEIAPDDVAFAESLLSLVPALFVTRGATQAGRADLLLRVKSYIDEHLADPRLDADQIAQAHFISRRYLYRLFEPEQAGVREWIRQRRLQQCAKELADPMCAHEGIFGIALRWGFANPAHFSRCFRGAFGVSPREYRATVLGAGDEGAVELQKA
jgi:AraC-like DNA-binding protein